MRLFERFFLRWHHDELRAMALQVAGPLQSLAWERTGARALDMTPAEARGYIRARSLDLVQDGIDRLLTLRGPELAVARNHLVELSREELVRGVLKQVFESRPLHAPLRRAA